MYQASADSCPDMAKCLGIHKERNSWEKRKNKRKAKEQLTVTSAESNETTANPKMDKENISKSMRLLSLRKVRQTLEK